MRGTTYTANDCARLRAVLLQVLKPERFGFMRADELAVIAGHTETHLTPVLIRCGGCRFMATAQDAQHLIDIVQRDGEDYVRNVSFPADTLRQLRLECGQ